MSKIVQEKFEVRMPRVPEGVENTGWMSDRSARVKKGLPGRDQGWGPCDETNQVMFNSLPPGMDIEDQEQADVRQQPEVMSGESDVSKDYTPQGLKYGYTRRQMRPTDDMYTREHHDSFYDEIKAETEDGMNTGFIERNNNLDRM